MGPFLPDLQCPWCGLAMARSDGLDPTARPEAGDVSICVACLRLGIFTGPAGRLGLRQATPAEQAERLAVDRDLVAALATLRADPLRQVGQAHAEVQTRRWRRQLPLRHPLPPLPPLREVDPGSQ